jgi:hypothetical protein
MVSKFASIRNHCRLRVWVVGTSRKRRIKCWWHVQCWMLRWHFSFVYMPLPVLMQALTVSSPGSRGPSWGDDKKSQSILLLELIKVWWMPWIIVFAISSAGNLVKDFIQNYSALQADTEAKSCNKIQHFLTQQHSFLLWKHKCSLGSLHLLFRQRLACRDGESLQINQTAGPVQVRASHLLHSGSWFVASHVMRLSVCGVKKFFSHRHKGISQI